MARELTEVGVVGLGTMGAGISEVLARAGLSVTAVDVDGEAVARGRGHVEQSTDRAPRAAGHHRVGRVRPDGSGCETARDSGRRSRGTGPGSLEGMAAWLEN